MQRFSKLLCVLAGLASTAGATTATESAKVWLRRHPAVQQDELSDLKDENPSAYAIVKALLTKRSLGLLDPKHPTASFSAAPPKQDDNAPSGAAAFSKFVTPAELAAVGKGKDAPAADGSAVSEDGEIQAPVVSHHHGDWLNWKPADSATEDDSMVDSVLGAVPQTPKKSLLSSSRSDSPFAQDEALLAPDVPASTAAPAVVAVAAPVQAAAPASEENPYLKGIDLGSPAAKPEEPKKAALSATNNVNYLASFSWGDDEAATKPTAAPKQRLLQKKQMQTQAAPKSDNTFMSWLNGASPAVAAKPAPVAPAAPQEQNPYTAGLW